MVLFAPKLDNNGPYLSNSEKAHRSCEKKKRKGKRESVQSGRKWEEKLQTSKSIVYSVTLPGIINKKHL